ncbi:MAG: translation initiation factor IF-2 [Proteobacteria bacterium]|nr:translation initiation factor IF-2 [Pseudomonadota bacterium]
MADISIIELAKLIHSTPERLLEQLKEAGVPVNNIKQSITPDQKRQLLMHLQKVRTASSSDSTAPVESATLSKKRPKITLQHKTVGVVKQGKKSVNVEFRAKKTFTKPTAPTQTEQATEPAATSTPPATSNQEEQVEKTIEPATASVTETPAVAPIEPAAKVEADESVARKKKEKGRRETREARKPFRPELMIEEETEGEEFFNKSKTSKRKKKVSKESVIAKSTAVLEQSFAKPTAPIIKDIPIPESISVADLAKKMSVKAAEIIKIMMKMGAMATINQILDKDTATLVVSEMGHNPVPTQTTVEEDFILSEELSTIEPISRAPVVTIMGHVDHGKTSLLDYIRRTKVTSTEAGGITQHIGAYRVQVEKGAICFLDTPGHEAFTAMRARGAQCTDIVILVVAADDGVMPQTIEAIQHAKAAKVPIIVAINKMDKPEADPDRIRNELSQHGVLSEEWGGETMFQPISAKTGQGVSDLLERILLQAEVLELKAVPTGPAKGVVIESRLDKGLGPVATVLILRGELKKGDVVLTGREYGRVRAMIGDNGQERTEAGPSTPVELLGLSGTPIAGDEMNVVNDERKAREIAQFRQGKYREVRLAKRKTAHLEGVFEQLQEGKRAVLNVVLKADVQGSVEAISDSLNKITSDIAKINIISSGIGAITASDINLAIASQAIVIGFNVRADATARQIASNENVDLRYYSIIYNLLDEVKSALSGLLSPTKQEKIAGIAEVREVFRATKHGTIAGCMVTEGYLKRTLPVRVLRNNVVIFEGHLESLRRFKDDVSEVRQGNECGIGIKGYNDIHAGDQVESYEIVTVKRTLS